MGMRLLKPPLRRGTPKKERASQETCKSTGTKAEQNRVGKEGGGRRGERAEEQGDGSERKIKDPRRGRAGQSRQAVM